MIRNYALLFAAVTLRIQLPLLAGLMNAFETPYAIISWLSWVPNALWAEWYLRRSQRTAGTNLPKHSLASAGS
jgi:hypothetical protein